MLQKIKYTLLERGFILTSALALFCLFLFYGKLLQHPNQTYFGANGDGLQSYYSALYHVEHDNAYWHMNGMNHPYGEQVFFTGCQPFVTNIIKLVSTVIDISDHTIGILNCIMLFSIVFSAIFLYLIFKHLKLPDVYSAIVSVAIAFLSPQIDRMGGHYSLTYQFAIPLFLLLLLKFYEQPSIKRSFVMSMLVFFMAGTHFYFFGFFAIIAAFYWMFLFVSKEREFGKIQFVAKHFLIQIILPFLVFKFIVFLIDVVDDRTNNPWGYLSFVSNLTGVFFPIDKPYASFLQTVLHPKYPDWEGQAFVGIVSTIVTIGIVLSIIFKLLKMQFKQVLQVTDHILLNSFFLAALVALLLSFGLPFTAKGGDILFNYAGLLKQMRGIARFTWVFYYVINIIAFYKIFQWTSNKKNGIQYFWITISVFFVCYDAYTMSIHKQDMFNNSIEQLADTNNQLPEDMWINEIDTDKYQAIITLPYFHVGSENIWMHTESEIVKDVFIASLKTGLPTTSLILSRVSLGQTYKNIQIVKEPYRPLEIVNDLKNTKPFLVLVRENELNANEHNLLKKCKKLMDTPRYTVYELEVSTLQHISDHLFDDVSEELSIAKTFDVDGFKYTDSIKSFVYDGFENNPSSNSFVGNGCYEGRIKDFNILFKGKLSNCPPDSTYTISFWMDNFTTDVYPRSTVEIAFMDSTGRICGTDYFLPRNDFAVLDGNWALIESSFKLKNKIDHLTVTFWNENIVDDEKILRVDELLIKPTGLSIYKNSSSDKILKNNRTYIKH